jgi:diaminopimelate decarboxylase
MSTAGETIMRTVGYVATAIASAIALGVMVLVIESLPDIRRYIQISRM